MTPNLGAIALLASLLGSATLAVADPRSDVPSFAALLKQRPPLRDVLDGQHPRLFFDRQGLDALRAKAARHPDEWRAFRAASWALTSEPPAPPAQDRGVHYQVGLAVPEAAFAAAITRDPADRARAMRWIDATVSYDPWGYTYNKPNQDIPAAFLLYGLAFAYDVLWPDFSPADRGRIASTLGQKASRLFDAYRPKGNKRYSFSQNHTYINAAAIGFAGLVLRGEHPDADEWIVFSRAVFDRVVRTYSPDGYYYEGYHYFEFSVPWIVHYLDAMEFNTDDERWYERLRLDLAKYYVAHSLVPGPLLFDFGDAGRGAGDRHGAQALLGAHNILYRLSARYRDPEALAVAEWVRREVKLPWREPMWTFIWRDPTGAPGSIDSIPRFYHFTNAGAVFFRTSWDLSATAVAFKCGPPEGHHTTALLEQLPEWRLSTGHAHPDAGSFIVIARGRYLTGDAGYTGVKMTADHNTLLVDGRGQENDGRHEVFAQVPYARLDRLRILSAVSNGSGIDIVADGAAAYAADLGVELWRRVFRFDGSQTIQVIDEIRTKAIRRVSLLIHADESIVRTGARQYTATSGGMSMTIETDLSSPDDATIAPHIVVTQGRPGSVEQGEREVRGVRLSVIGPPGTAWRSTLTLRIQDPGTGDQP